MTDRMDSAGTHHRKLEDANAPDTGGRHHRGGGHRRYADARDPVRDALDQAGGVYDRRAEARRLGEPSPVHFTGGDGRYWFLVILVFGLGLADLWLRGWGVDARLLLLASVVVAALVIGQRAGQVVLGLTVLVLVGYGLTSAGPHAIPTATWTTGAGVVLVLGLLILWTVARLASRFEDKLVSARQEGRLLARTVLDTRFDAVQAANQRPQRDTSLEHQTHYLEAALSVTQALAATHDVATLLSVAAEAISEQFGFSLVTVYLMDDGGWNHRDGGRDHRLSEWVTLRSASSVEGKSAALHGLRLRCGSDGPVGQVAAQGRSLTMNYAERQQQESGYLATVAAAKARTTLTLPLLVGQQVIGVLDLYSTDSDAFSEGDVTLLQRLADSLALSVDAAQRVSEGGFVLETDGLIYRTAKRLVTARSEREVYESILDAISNYQPIRALVIEAAEGGPRTGYGPQAGRRQPSNGRLRVVAGWYQGEMVFENHDLAERQGGRPSDLGAPVLAPGFIDVVILGLDLNAPLCVWDLADLDASLSPELHGALEGLADWLNYAAGELPIADELGERGRTQSVASQPDDARTHH
ncbi:MAG: GAF domain-containing protein, partial [Anaerolineae bacterium]|nr:GAF domain-containing protein [Anaerolineae bacterium]